MNASKPISQSPRRKPMDQLVQYRCDTALMIDFDTLVANERKSRSEVLRELMQGWVGRQNKPRSIPWVTSSGPKDFDFEPDAGAAMELSGIGASLIGLVGVRLPEDSTAQRSEGQFKALCAGNGTAVTRKFKKNKSA